MTNSGRLAYYFFIHRKFLDWFWFRTIHLAGVVLLVLLLRLGMRCPLSTAEIYLRLHTDSAFVEGFILHYLRKFLHEGIGPAFIVFATFVMFMGTLAAYLYRPPKRVEQRLERLMLNRRKPANGCLKNPSLFSRRAAIPFCQPLSLKGRG